VASELHFASINTKDRSIHAGIGDCRKDYQRTNVDISGFHDYLTIYPVARVDRQPHGSVVRFTQHTIDDNTQPSARMGRKAFRISRETAGLPKYLIDIQAPAYFVWSHASVYRGGDLAAICSSFHPARDRRQYSTIREGGAESLQDLSETAGLPKYLIDIQVSGFFYESILMRDS
jgi:hypothetical protein